VGPLDFWKQIVGPMSDGGMPSLDALARPEYFDPTMPLPGPGVPSGVGQMFAQDVPPPPLPEGGSTLDPVASDPAVTGDNPFKTPTPVAFG